jgi:hypothetical protein
VSANDTSSSINEPDRDPDRLTDEEQRTALINLEVAFRPSAPVNSEDLFSGRKEQRWNLQEAITAVGQHAIIFGERGVGKSSLAALTVSIHKTLGYIAVRVTCDVGDNFNSIWKKFADECAIYLADNPDHPIELEEAIERATDVLMSDPLSPAEVRIALRHILAWRPVVIFLDEFDQVSDPGSLELTSNLIKTLSDQIESVTLIPVGVADSIDQLIRGHQSISRNLVQVRMPRMQRQELQEIATTGFEMLGLRASHDAMRFLTYVPQGLPQYAHILGQEGARQALMESQRVVTTQHMLNGLRVGLDKMDHTLSSAYRQATYTARNSRYAEVLLACALTTRDEYGYFSPTDISPRFAEITATDHADVSRFNRHLIDLSEDRGEVLTQTGPPRRHRYRFTDPLMEPYVLLRGLDSGIITVDQMLGPAAAFSDVPSGLETLF